MKEKTLFCRIACFGATLHIHWDKGLFSMISEHIICTAAKTLRHFAQHTFECMIKVGVSIDLGPVR